MDKKKQNKPKGKRNINRLIISLVCLAIMGWGVWQFTMMAGRYDGESEVWIRIPAGASKEEASDSITAALGQSYGGRVVALWGGDPAKSRGAYKILPGDKAIDIARRLDYGRQTPIRLTFNNIRQLPQLAERISAKMDWKEGEFEKAFTAKAAALDISPAMLLGRMLPDTYEVYWTSSPSTVIDKILDNYNNFWTEERIEKARAMGLTPDEVGIIASISAEETNKADELPKVARLYLNRLQKGMKLQADPTVRYALNDFTIRRVTRDMLAVDSPYNTYLHAGLPPAPIRVPDSRALMGVLDAPEHDYIYMCARADFSGYHDFTADYNEHLRNAAAYRQALDQRGIK